MIGLQIDTKGERAIAKDALRLRARRLDKPASVVRAFATREARREMVENLMATNKGVV